MKLINLMIVFLGVSFSAMASSGDTSVYERKPIELKLVDKNKVQLMHRDNPQGLLYVKIYDEKQSLVANERIVKKDPFTKKYDFSQMAPGKYQIALFDAKGNQIENMEIDLHATNSEDVFTRVKLIGDNQYKLMVSATHPSDMEVSIFENGNLLYTEKFENTEGIHKIYTLQNTKFRSKIEFKVKTDDGFSKLVSAIN